MKATSLLLCVLSALGLYNLEYSENNNNQMNFYDLTATTIEGEDYNFSQLKGKKVLIVNTASECGLTPQYENLQELHKTMGGDDFIILGFPCNDFGSQEPGTEEEISGFCQKNYGVSFQMMSKVSVKGDDKSPVYKWLTEKSSNEVADYEVQWNFHKFLIDEKGNLVKEVLPQVLPIDESILTWIKS